MSDELKVKLLQDEIEKNDGILRMKPTWICRSFLPPGRRLKLHPDDLYPKGVDKGAICERWFVSTGAPVIGNRDASDETLTFISIDKGDSLISFKDAIDELGALLLGKETMDTLGGFKMFAKYFDHSACLPLHLHPMEKHAKAIGMNQKPESYYFSAELNNVTYDNDYTFFGLVPGTTKDDIRRCLRNYNICDNQILSFSQAYKIKMGTGWDLPAGMLHAPASLITYEPQYMSDAAVFYQNIVEEKYRIDWEMNLINIPDDYNGDAVEYFIDMINWEANLDPDFRDNHYHEPILVTDEEEMMEQGYYEKWISYGSEFFAAKELTVFPGETVTIVDDAAYGFVLTQGFGTINNMEISAPSVIRYGEMTADEAFVIKEAAVKGVTITNMSNYSNLVMLKHFNGDSKAALSFVKV
jgi:hypothetical protein